MRGGVEYRDDYKWFIKNGAPAIGSGIGDRLNCMSDFLYYKIGFDRSNFVNDACEHLNSGTDEFFGVLPEIKYTSGEKINGGMLDTDVTSKKRKKGLILRRRDGNFFYYDWGKAQIKANVIYDMLKIKDRKKSIIKKYNIPKNYFDKSVSLHLRFGDRKLTMVKPVSEYINYIQQIKDKIKIKKVICFYENDEFSTKEATKILAELKNKFPELDIEKAIQSNTSRKRL